MKIWRLLYFFTFDFFGKKQTVNFWGNIRSPLEEVRTNFFLFAFVTTIWYRLEKSKCH